MIGIDALLRDVCAQRSARGILALQRLEQRRRTGDDAELHRCRAVWSRQPCTQDFPGRAPRHLTMRRNRKAIACLPAPSAASCIAGDLVLCRGRLRLEPDSPGDASVHIEGSDIRRAAFFSGALDLSLKGGERLLIRCDDADALDLLFQAHL